MQACRNKIMTKSQSNDCCYRKMDKSLQTLRDEMAQLAFLNIQLMDKMIEMESFIESIKQDRLDMMLDGFKTKLFDMKVDRLAGKKENNSSRKDSNISLLTEDDYSGTNPFDSCTTNRANCQRGFHDTDNTKDTSSHVGRHLYSDRTVESKSGIAGISADKNVDKLRRKRAATYSSAGVHSKLSEAVDNPTNLSVDKPGCDNVKRDCGAGVDSNVDKVANAAASTFKDIYLTNCVDKSTLEIGDNGVDKQACDALNWPTSNVVDLRVKRNVGKTTQNTANANVDKGRQTSADYETDKVAYATAEERTCFQADKSVSTAAAAFSAAIVDKPANRTALNMAIITNGDKVEHKATAEMYAFSDVDKRVQATKHERFHENACANEDELANERDLSVFHGMSCNFDCRRTIDSASFSAASSTQSFSSSTTSGMDCENDDVFYDSSKTGSLADSGIDIMYDLPHRFSFMMASTSTL